MVGLAMKTEFVMGHCCHGCTPLAEKNRLPFAIGRTADGNSLYVRVPWDEKGQISREGNKVGKRSKA